jgi:hypothetical protein
MLAMHAVAAIASGFNRERCQRWIEREHLASSLTVTEQHFIHEETANRSTYVDRIEGIWTLAWALFLFKKLDFETPCDENFVWLMPDLKRDETATRLRQRIKLRALSELIASLDLAYCLHWVIRDHSLGAIGNARIDPRIVVERRRALEWLLGSEDYDALTLDT